MLQLLAFLPLCLSSPSLEVVFDWSNLPRLPIAWPNSSWAALHGNKKASVIGIKVQQDRIFLTLPRWHGNSHPLNLAEVSAPEGRHLDPSAPSLQPFPSWEAQKLGDCSAIQSVQSMELEEGEGMMWIPDMGRKTRGQSPGCPAKIVMVSLATGAFMHSHTFTRTVVPSSGSFLNDIALNVAKVDDKMAYISDSDRGVLVVFSLKKDRSWTVSHSSMRADLRGATFSFINPPARLRIADNHINGLAVSPASQGSQHLYYSPLTGLKLWRLDTAGLVEEGGRIEVLEVGDKVSQTDGMAMDSSGRLYLQELTNNAISVWDSGTAWAPERLVQDNKSLVWVDTMALGKGGLWATSRGWPLDSQPRVVRVVEMEKCNGFCQTLLT